MFSYIFEYFLAKLVYFLFIKLGLKWLENDFCTNKTWVITLKWVIREEKWQSLIYKKILDPVGAKSAKERQFFTSDVEARETAIKDKF